MATLNAIYKISADISNLQAGVTRGVQATESLEKSAKSLNGTLSTIGKAFAATFTVGAITSAVKSFTDFTGTLTDLSAKTGISTTELQKLKYAAELSGGSLETVTKAVGLMARNLIEGDTSAVGAMKRLGLNLDEIRQMQPGQAFSTIADAIAKIPNPMERSTLAMQMFGKSGAELLPMITGNMNEVFAAAERLGIVMDEETVKAGDRLGDTWTTLSAVGKGLIGQILTPMLPAIQLVADAMVRAGGVVTWLQEAFQTLLKWGVQALKFFIDAAITVTEFASTVPILGRSMREVDRSALESARSWSVWFGDMAKGMEVVVPKAVTQTTSLKTAVGMLTTEQKAGTKATTDYHKQLAALDLAQTLKSHAALVDGFRDYNAATIKAQLETARTGLQVNEFGREVVVTHGAQLAWLMTIAEGNRVILPALVQQMSDAAVASIKLGKTFSENLKGGLVKNLQDIPQTIVNAFTGGGNIMGAVKGIASSIGSTIGGAIGKTIGMLGSLGGPIGAAVGSLAGPLIGWIGNLFGSAGRDAVKDFAASFGGFDALRAKLTELGAQGERLWINLTQGVGRNNPEEARKAIEAINAAFGAQGEQLSRALATAEKYGITLEQMGDKFQQSKIDQMAKALIQDFSDLLFLGVDVGVIIEKMSGAIQEFVTLALKTGSEVPAAMQPMIAKMIEMGTLLDENGAIITDLSQIPFAKTMTEGFKDVVEAINRVAAALGYVFDTFDNRTLRIPTQILAPDVIEPPIEGFAHGSRGIRDFGAGTLAMLHGREAVVTEAQLGGLRGGGTLTIVNVTELDGDVVARRVDRYQMNQFFNQRRVGFAT